MRPGACLRTVVGRVEQQHDGNSHQSNRTDKDTWHCMRSPDERCRKDKEAPREVISEGFLDPTKLGTSANPATLFP
jgi:hypothetical protein